MNFTLSTDLGDLDFLGEVTGLGTYKDVRATADLQVINGMQIAVPSLVGLCSRNLKGLNS